MTRKTIFIAPSLLMIATAAAATATSPRIEFVDPLSTSSLAQSGDRLTPFGMFQAADGFVQAIIIVLLLASLITWTIGIAKATELRRERRNLRDGMRKLLSAADIASVGNTGYAPLADMVVKAEDEIAASGRIGAAMPGEGIKDRVALRLDRIEAALRRRAGRGIGVLAIIGSTAPFVGLTGTVWGIMNSFIGIAQSKTTNLAVVAPGIAEALLTTGIGLIAAIPAVILYNVFARILSSYAGEVGDAGAAVLCLAGREVDRVEARS